MDYTKRKVMICIIVTNLKKIPNYGDLNMRQLVAIMVVLFLSACSTVQVDVDYDTSYDFTGETKYSVVSGKTHGEDTLIGDRVKKAIKRDLDAKGYKSVDKDAADLLFVYHLKVKNKSDVYMDYQSMGFGAFGFGGGMIATPQTYNYTEGRLIIDAFDPIMQKIVWRGIASDQLTQSSSTPQEKTEYINGVVAKIMNKFPH